MASTAKTLGELMKEHRNRLQLTQEEVAEMIDCHPQYYKNLEMVRGIQVFRFSVKLCEH